MLYAILSDLHGNLPALRAATEAAKRDCAEGYILAGDLIFDWPYGDEIIAYAQSLPNVHIVSGNREGYIPRLLATPQYDGANMGAMYQMVRELSQSSIDWLTALPDTLTIEDEHCKMFITHATDVFGDSHEERGTVYSSSNFRDFWQGRAFDADEWQRQVDAALDRKRDVFDVLNADVVIYGHSHNQHHGYAATTLVINPGGTGLPCDGRSGASYTLLDTATMIVTERRAEYDIEALIAHTKTTELYRRGHVWVNLNCLMLRNGWDYTRMFFNIAWQVQQERGESGFPYSDVAWQAAAQRFSEQTGHQTAEL